MSSVFFLMINDTIVFFLLWIQFNRDLESNLYNKLTFTIFRSALSNEKETFTIYKTQLGEEHEKTKAGI